MCCCLVYVEKKIVHSLQFYGCLERLTQYYCIFNGWTCSFLIVILFLKCCYRRSNQFNDKHTKTMFQFSRMTGFKLFFLLIIKFNFKLIENYTFWMFIWFGITIFALLAPNWVFVYSKTMHWNVFFLLFPFYLHVKFLNILCTHNTTISDHAILKNIHKF